VTLSYFDYVYHYRQCMRLEEWVGLYTPEGSDGIRRHASGGRVWDGMCINVFRHGDDRMICAVILYGPSDTQMLYRITTSIASLGSTMLRIMVEYASDPLI
jgi:hypothetical protein